jgi:hypothetical protein
MGGKVVRGIGRLEKGDLFSLSSETKRGIITTALSALCNIESGFIFGGTCTKSRIDRSVAAGGS